jgi:site-specific DNA-methyltransferase (adenine-specific)
VTVTRIGFDGPVDPKRDRLVRRHAQRWEVVREVGPLRAACGCGAPTIPGVVLDPFFGTGTVAQVAEQYGRDWVGIELNPEFGKLAEARIAKARGVLAA